MNTDIIVPCRNEAGGIEALLSAILNKISPNEKVIVVEGGSYDPTWEVVSRFASTNHQIVALKQPGKGKFDAVLEGVRASSQKYVMIWDADGTVAFEDNLRIYNFQTDKPFLVTGDRLKGKREAGAMQFFNLIGNYVFAILWGILLNRSAMDTLCGTKKFPRELLESAPNWLMKSDPYGDFAIIGTAMYEDLKIQSLPVNYAARKYGKTNIRRWSGGLILLKLTARVFFGRFLNGRK